VIPMGKKFTRKQTIGLILIIAAAIHFIPVIKGLDWLAALVTFAIGIYLLVK
jgi:hypothetical protein